MLKTSSIAKTQPQKSMVVDNQGMIDGGKLNKKLSKSKNPAFLNANARQAFTRLRQAFNEAPILSHFDLECYIWIETVTSGYAIVSVLSQLTSNSSQ